jgi:hypothetical protein
MYVGSGYKHCTCLLHCKFDTTIQEECQQGHQAPRFRNAMDDLYLQQCSFRPSFVAVARALAREYAGISDFRPSFIQDPNPRPRSKSFQDQ